MKKFSRMTLANIRNNGLKIVLGLVLAGGPLVTLGLVQFENAPSTIAGGSHIDDVDPG